MACSLGVKNPALCLPLSNLLPLPLLYCASRSVKGISNLSLTYLPMMKFQKPDSAGVEEENEPMLESQIDKLWTHRFSPKVPNRKFTVSTCIILLLYSIALLSASHAITSVVDGKQRMHGMRWMWCEFCSRPSIT